MQREELKALYSGGMVNGVNKNGGNKTFYNEKEAYVLMKKIPMFPRQAYKSKKCLGIKSVMNFNLSQAKKEYPNEF